MMRFLHALVELETHSNWNGKLLLQFASPFSKTSTEPAVSIAMRVGSPVFLPEQEQSDAFLFQLLVDT